MLEEKDETQWVKWGRVKSRVERAKNVNRERKVLILIPCLDIFDVAK